MIRSDVQLLLGVATLAIAACSSTSGIETTDPITNPQGQTTQQRNLLLSDLSYASPGNGRAVDEVFELAVSSFRVAPETPGQQDPNAPGPVGLVRGTASREMFNQGNTMTFSAENNVFRFNIDTLAGLIDVSVNDILLQDPGVVDSIANSQIAKVYGSNPALGFDDNRQPYTVADLYPLDGIDENSSWQAIAAALTQLEESEDESANDYFTQLSALLNSLINGGDQYFYGITEPDGVSVFEITNMNSDKQERVTDTVAIGSLTQFKDDGDIVYSHMVFGHRTPTPEVPTSGSASFEGKLVGSALTNNSVRSLTGSAFLDVNFGTGLLDLTLASVIREGGNAEGTTTFLDYKTVSGTGVITDNTFAGSLYEEGGNSTGEFDGGFFGPIANEAGGTFAFGDGTSYATGAFTAAQPREDD
jgi:hypothetical protein